MIMRGEISDPLRSMGAILAQLDLRSSFFWLFSAFFGHERPTYSCEASGKPQRLCESQGLLELGVYLTTAVKCSKTGYNIQSKTVKACSSLLADELNLFRDVKAYLLMGDVAIKAINIIAQHAGEARVIPAGSTYKLRSQEYTFRGKRAYPSYLQAGPSFYIEKSKRRMIAEDIASALAYIGGPPGV